MGYEVIKIDIIILSYAKNNTLKSLTEQTISSLINSEKPNEISFNIIVIESEKTLAPYQFKHSVTLYPKESFGFHRYLNLGIKASSNAYICLCNNDLIFQENWASEILKAFNKNPKLKSANPICINFEPTERYLNNTKPVIANRLNIFQGILTGWCIFIDREIIDKIGYLDEQFEFWYADRDYGMTLLKHKIQHALIPMAKVLHLANQSYDSIDQSKFNKLTSEQKLVFDKKWHNSLWSKLQFYLIGIYLRVKIKIGLH